jgi:flagellar protein FlgJ
VARQFEGLLLQMMLKSMRETQFADGALDGQQGELYREMYDKQIASSIAEGRGLGLATIIERQLGGTPDKNDMAAPAAGFPLSTARRMATSAITPTHTSDAPVASALDEIPLSARLPDSAPGTSATAHFDSPRDFIASLWPDAVRAGRELGVSPRVLIAQAALETGWGRHIPRNADGSTSHNLFGIKAGSHWEGARVPTTTLEYSAGALRRERADFRSYGSYEQSFRDYVGFLRDNPRYAGALAQGDNPRAFASALQRAGYATDPNYASKIGAIVNGGTLHTALAALKSTLA